MSAMTNGKMPAGLNKLLGGNGMGSIANMMGDAFGAPTDNKPPRRRKKKKVRRRK